MFRRRLMEAPVALTFNDVILLPGYTEVEPREVILETRFSKGIVLGIPLVSSPMDTVTGHRLAAEMARLGGIGVLHRNMSIEQQVREARLVKEADPTGPSPTLDDEGRLRVAAAISPFDQERALKLEKHVDALVSDIAHFHNSRVLDAAKRLAGRVGVEFIAGNIGTYEAALDVVSRIEDVAGLRVGVASGSICSTGEVTGVAAPTLYAVASVADALEELGARDIPIIADGGIRGPGDGAKALAAGASSLMLGYVLAGTDEATGFPVTVEGKCFKEYRGMASPASRALRYARDRYAEKPAKDIAEGVEGLVPCRGPLSEVVKEFVAGLQAAMGYVGAGSIRDMWVKARFARVTELGQREISPHSVMTGLSRKQG